jgi:hypothetical protein
MDSLHVLVVWLELLGFQRLNHDPLVAPEEFYKLLFLAKDSSVDFATKRGLDGPGLIPGSVRFSLLHSDQTESGDNPASCPMRNGDSLSPELKRPGLEADHSP